jgi:hypothetical protein
MPHRIGIPRRTVEQVLQAVRGGLFRRFGKLPAVLAFDRAQQSQQICLGMPLPINAAKTRLR